MDEFSAKLFANCGSAPALAGCPLPHNISQRLTRPGPIDLKACLLAACRPGELVLPRSRQKKMPTIPSEETIAKKFRLEQAPTLLAQHDAIAPIAFTRLRSTGASRRRTVACAA